MIHKYKLAGYNIVLDVNSGGVHVVDDLTYDILDNIEQLYGKKSYAYIMEKKNSVDIDDEQDFQLAEYWAMK